MALMPGARGFGVLAILTLRDPFVAPAERIFSRGQSVLRFF